MLNKLPADFTKEFSEKAHGVTMFGIDVWTMDRTELLACIGFVMEAAQKRAPAARGRINAVFKGKS